MQKRQFIDILIGKKMKKDVATENNHTNGAVTYQYNKMLAIIADDLDKLTQELLLDK